MVSLSPTSPLPLANSARVVAAPGLDAVEEELGEGLDLVGGEERCGLEAHGGLALFGAEELPGDAVELLQVLVAELLEAGGLEALLGDLGVAIEALFVGWSPRRTPPTSGCWSRTTASGSGSS
jgi:hypothetical protein